MPGVVTEGIDVGAVGVVVTLDTTDGTVGGAVGKVCVYRCVGGGLIVPNM